MLSYSNRTEPNRVESNRIEPNQPLSEQTVLKRNRRVYCDTAKHFAIEPWSIPPFFFGREFFRVKTKNRSNWWHFFRALEKKRHRILATAKWCCVCKLDKTVSGWLYFCAYYNWIFFSVHEMTGYWAARTKITEFDWMLREVMHHSFQDNPPGDKFRDMNR